MVVFCSLPTTVGFLDLEFILIFGGWPPDCYTKRVVWGGGQTPQSMFGVESMYLVLYSECSFIDLGTRKVYYSLCLSELASSPMMKSGCFLEH